MVSSIAVEQSQFNISYLHTVCSIRPIDRTLSGATTLGQSGPGNNGNDGVLHIPQISKAGTSPSNGLMLYPGCSVEWGGGLTPLHRYSQCILLSESTGLLIANK